MVEIARSEAMNRRRIDWAVPRSRHDKHLVELLQDAATIKTIPNPCDRARTEAFSVCELLPFVGSERLASHQHIIVVGWRDRSSESDPLSIWRPRRFTDTVEHTGQFTSFASTGVNQPELVPLLLTVGKEQQTTAIGCPCGVRVVFAAACQLAPFPDGMSLLVQVKQPDSTLPLIPGFIGGMHDEGHTPAIGGKGNRANVFEGPEVIQGEFTCCGHAKVLSSHTPLGGYPHICRTTPAPFPSRPAIGLASSCHCARQQVHVPIQREPCPSPSASCRIVPTAR